jgi:hypothetical protein
MSRWSEAFDAIRARDTVDTIDTMPRVGVLGPYTVNSVNCVNQGRTQTPSPRHPLRSPQRSPRRALPGSRGTSRHPTRRFGEADDRGDGPLARGLLGHCCSLPPLYRSFPFPSIIPSAGSLFGNLGRCVAHVGVIRGQATLNRELLVRVQRSGVWTGPLLRQRPV